MTFDQLLCFCFRW